MWKTVNSIKDNGARGRAVFNLGYDNAGIPHHSTSSIDYINVPSLETQLILVNYLHKVRMLMVVVVKQGVYIWVNLMVMR